MPVNLLLSYWCLSLHSRPKITVTLYSTQLLVYLQTNVTHGRFTQLHSLFVSICSPYNRLYKTSITCLPRSKRHLSILPFPPNCFVKTTCQVSLDSRGCIFHQLPDRFRSRSFSDISSLNPPLSVEALTIF